MTLLHNIAYNCYSKVKTSNLTFFNLTKDRAGRNTTTIHGDMGYTLEEPNQIYRWLDVYQLPRGVCCISMLLLIIPSSIMIFGDPIEDFVALYSMQLP